ncbi:MAG: caspase family protein [Proteobacteria bacterium]|jgi:hypothetical protein|nr:caspase family protein [Pseudomonadota bacterium]
MIISLLINAALAAPPSIDLELDSGAVAPHDAAVVIGIEKYVSLPAVPYARKDSRAVKEHLVHVRGVTEEKVHLLKEPNRDEILAALEQATKQVQPGGTLWIYFAGHGIASPVNGSRLLIAGDMAADENLIPTHTVGVVELAELAEASAAAQSVLVFDVGFGGVGRNGLEVMPAKRFAVSDDYEPPDNVAVWTATKQSQLAGVMKQVEHGAFTYFVVGALRGWADGVDGAPDGKVTLNEAQAYVAKGLSSVGLRGQTPTIDERDEVFDWVLGEGVVLEQGPDLEHILEMESASGDRLGLLSGQDVGISRVTATEEAIQLDLRQWSGPLEKVGGSYVDANKKKLAWPDLKQIAILRDGGKEALQKLKGLQIAEGSLLATGSAIAIPTALCLAKSKDERGKGCQTTVIVGLTTSLSALTIPLGLSAGAKKVKSNVLGEANKVLDEFQQHINTQQ